MKIEIWSDYQCPFCYIGKRRFEQALERFPHKQEIEVIYRSFELDPNAKKDVGFQVYDMLASKYGMSRDQAVANTASVAAQAQTLGLTYKFDTMILTNSFDAHRLTHYAASQGKMQDMTERLLKAYFTESKHIGDHETLAGLAGEIGLDPVEAARVLASGAYAEEVRADEREAERLGVRGVPFFVIDRKYAISGAQSSESFLSALQQAWDESKPLTVLIGSNSSTDEGDAACSDGVCTPKQS
jgi:predicted DsbA family dithiol-disulfide isomerase